MDEPDRRLRHPHGRGTGDCGRSPLCHEQEGMKPTPAIVDLAGQRGLVVGIANESSIAPGCARAFPQERTSPSTYLNAKRLSLMSGPCGSARHPSSSLRRSLAGELEAVFDQIDQGSRAGSISCPLGRCATRRPAHQPCQLLGGRLRRSHGRLMPFLHPDGQACRTPDDAGGSLQTVSFYGRTGSWKITI